MLQGLSTNLKGQYFGLSLGLTFGTPLEGTNDEYDFPDEEGNEPTLMAIDGQSAENAIFVSHPNFMLNNILKGLILGFSKLRLPKMEGS